MRHDLAARVAAAVGDSRCVVALGGGADSAVLLAAAVEASGNGSVRAVFAHHGLEGSEMLRESATLVSARFGVDLSVVEAVVEDGPDLEARARRARYKAITENLADTEVCCTGHTSDDQAETVLMRLLRGSGATGLAGIPATRGQFRRPFLDVSRTELRQVAQAEDLPFADDPANTDDRFLRSRIRNELIPTIETGYGAGLKSNLTRTSTLVGADDAVLNSVAGEIPIRVNRWEVGLPVGALLTAPDAVASRVVRRGLKEFHQPYRGGFEDVGSIMATATDGVSRTISDGVECARENAEVVLFRKECLSKLAHEVSSAIPVSADSLFDWLDERFCVYTSDSPAIRATTRRRTGVRALVGNEEMTVRGVADGDRIDIPGGTTPVVELLRNAGVPSRRRPFWMVVTINGKIAALHGIRVAPWARPIVGESAMIIEREGR
jgi:tRNA(Ile)-lysidine synthetase-like protein